MSGATVKIHISEIREPIPHEGAGPGPQRVRSYVTIDATIGDRLVVIRIPRGEFSKALAQPGKFPAIAEFAEISDAHDPKRAG
jgi:hypothetical protein